MRIASADGVWGAEVIRRDGREVIRVTQYGYYVGETFTAEGIEGRFPGLLLAECREV